MRILIATEHEAIVGGVETYLRALLPELQDSGHELALLTVQPLPAGSPSIGDGCQFLKRVCLSGSSLSACLAELDRWGPEVCYLHGLSEPAVEEALLTRYRVLFFCHNYHGTCVSGTKRHGWPRPRPCSRRFGAACLALYLPRRCGGASPRTMWRMFRVQLRRNRLLRRYPRVAVAGSHMREELVRNGVDPNRVAVVHLFPTDHKADETPPAPRPFSDRLLVLGRLTELKGTHLLLRAMPRIQERLRRRIELIVAGDGADRPRLQRLATKFGLATRFVGWADAATKTALMRESDLLILPGTWPEPFGLVGIEAGGVGLPSVAFDVGGIPEWCRDGVSGILAREISEESLAEAVVRALLDPEAHHRLRVGAWEVARGYSLDRHVDSLIDHLTQMAGEGRPPNEPVTAHA